MLATLIGCSSEPDLGLVVVSGIVTYKGKPLTDGVVSFVREDGAASGAAGVIDGNGRYVLKWNRQADGVLPGKYRIRIESVKAAPGRTIDGQENVVLAIPPKYFRVETSGLTVTVNETPPEQTIDLDLAD